MISWRNFSITTKITIFIVVITSFLVSGFVFIYLKQLKNIDSYNRATVSAVENVIMLSVINYLYTEEEENLIQVIKNTIDEGLIFGIVILSEKSDIIFKYPSNFNVMSGSVNLPLRDRNAIRPETCKIYFNETQRNEAKEYFTSSMIIFIGLVILAIILSVIFLNRHLVQPILALSAQALKIAGGNYHVGPIKNVSDEIGILNKSLIEIASSFKEKVTQQERHLNEIVKANGELVLDRNERTNYLDALINNSTPHITEALVALQSITDRPIQHGMLNKSLLIVLTQFEHTRLILDETNASLQCFFEKVTLGDYSRLLNEYANFFSVNKRSSFEYCLMHDPALNVEKTIVLVDIKLIIKLLSLLFEVMESNFISGAPRKTTIRLMVDTIKEGIAKIEVVIKSDHCALTDEDCNLINTYFQHATVSGIETEEFPPTTRFNKKTIKYLRYLTSSVKAQYYICNMSGKFESHVDCGLLTCEQDESIGSRLARFKSGLTDNTITMVGTTKVIRAINYYKQAVEIIDYEKFMSQPGANQESHYVIDMISNRFDGKRAADHLRSIGLIKKNFVLLIEQKHNNDEFKDYCYEVGADIIIIDYLSQENIAKILGEKQRAKTSLGISEIIGALAVDGVK